MGDKRTINTAGGDYAEGNIDKRQGTFIGEQHNYFQPPTAPLDRQQQRYRRAMLAKVKSIWIEGLLEQSLAKELRIVLDLTEQPNAVDLPLNALVQELNRPTRTLPSGPSIIKVFEQMGGTLLILGAPGAGKTTLLLELARDLIARAEQDKGFPIPVVFNLSSWVEQRRPLTEWLVEELNTKYDVPRKLAQTWMDVDVVLPLLDGLDEVVAEHGSECVEVINAYRQEHGLVSLAVCSRVAEYEALATKLRLQGAIVVQPLTKQQVAAYLERAGEKLAGVRAALRYDTVLDKLLDTPLMLSIMVLAYAEQSAVEVQDAGTLEERRRHLFDSYIAAMFKRRSKVETRYTKGQTVRWLSWLAWKMTQHNQTLFHLEQLQKDWLSTRLQYRQYVLGVVLVLGLVLGTIVGLASGLIFGLTNGFLFGLCTSVVLGPLWGRRSATQPIKVVDKLHWSWSRGIFQLTGNVVQTAIFGLLAAAVYALVFGVAGSLIFGPGGLGFGIAVGTGFGLTAVLFSRLTMDEEVETRTSPNQGIHRSVLYACGVGGVAGLLTGGIQVLSQIIVASEFGWSVGLAGGVAGGVAGGWNAYGGETVVRHTLLRLILWRSGAIPWNYTYFLDHCAERIFLRKVGGGYIFVHRLLMEHFASLYTEQLPAEPVEAQRTTS